MKFLLIYFSFLSLFQTAFAGGNIVGDGGHVVYCPSKKKIKRPDQIKLLDLLESEILFNQHPDLTANRSSLQMDTRLVFEGIFKSFEYHMDGSLFTFYCSRSSGYGAEFCHSLIEARLRAYTALGSHEFLKIFNHALDIALDNSSFFNDPSSIFQTKIAPAAYSQIQIPQDCALIPLAIYHRGNVCVKEFYYDKMDDLNVVSFWIHEAMHRWFGSQSSSLPVRQAIMYLTASEKFRIINSNAFVQLIETKQAQKFKPETNE